MTTIHRILLSVAALALLSSCASPSLPLHIKRIGIIANVPQASNKAASCLQQRNWIVRTMRQGSGSLIEDDTACRMGRNAGVDAVVIVYVTGLNTQQVNNHANPLIPDEMKRLMPAYSTNFLADAQAHCIDVRSGNQLWSNQVNGIIGQSGDQAASNAVNVLFTGFINPFPRRL
jgi:hypothetical protein